MENLPILNSNTNIKFQNYSEVAEKTIGYFQLRKIWSLLNILVFLHLLKQQQQQNRCIFVPEGADLCWSSTCTHTIKVQLQSPVHVQRLIHVTRTSTRSSPCKTSSTVKLKGPVIWKIFPFKYLKRNVCIRRPWSDMHDTVIL